MQYQSREQLHECNTDVSACYLPQKSYIEGGISFIFPKQNSLTAQRTKWGSHCGYICTFFTEAAAPMNSFHT